MTEKAETKNAMVHVLRQTDDAIREQFGRGASDEEVENYVEKIRGTWNDRINEFLAMDLIAEIRSSAAFCIFPVKFQIL